MTANITFFRKHKETLTYSVCLTVLLFILNWLELRFVIFDLSFEIYIGLIAIIFTALGIWLALKLSTPKIETVVVEKEIYIETPQATEINQQEISKLGISKRELEVLNLMATGLSNEEIAAKLFIGLNTVKTHSSNIFLKLEVKRRTQAIEKAKRLNIIN